MAFYGRLFVPTMLVSKRLQNINTAFGNINLLILWFISQNDNHLLSVLIVSKVNSIYRLLPKIQYFGRFTENSRSGLIRKSRLNKNNVNRSQLSIGSRSRQLIQEEFLYEILFYCTIYSEVLIRAILRPGNALFITNR